MTGVNVHRLAATEPTASTAEVFARRAYGWEAPPLQDPGPVLEVGARDLHHSRVASRTRIMRLATRTRSRFQFPPRDFAN